MFSYQGNLLTGPIYREREKERESFSMNTISLISLKAKIGPCLLHCQNCMYSFKIANNYHKLKGIGLHKGGECGVGLFACSLV